MDKNFEKSSECFFEPFLKFKEKSAKKLYCETFTTTAATTSIGIVKIKPFSV
jgi:phage terminase large subunit-like protein